MRQFLDISDGDRHGADGDYRYGGSGDGDATLEHPMAPTARPPSDRAYNRHDHSANLHQSTSKRNTVSDHSRPADDFNEDSTVDGAFMSYATDGDYEESGAFGIGIMEEEENEAQFSLSEGENENYLPPSSQQQPPRKAACVPNNPARSKLTRPATIIDCSGGGRGSKSNGRPAGGGGSNGPSVGGGEAYSTARAKIPSDDRRKPVKRRRPNTALLLAVIIMMVLGLVAVAFGVIFAVGLIDFGGGSGSNGNDALIFSEADVEDIDDSETSTKPSTSPTPGPSVDTDGTVATDTPTTAGPSSKPTTNKPTSNPTATPTTSPTAIPTTRAPTPRPTTSSPTAPPTTNIWTSTPTAELEASGVAPPLPPGYFNYDPDDLTFGPTSWSNPIYSSNSNSTLNVDGALVAVQPTVNSSSEFQFWGRHSASIKTNKKTTLMDNFCDPTNIWGPGNEWKAEQSPIDVRVTNGMTGLEEIDEETGEVVEARCFEHHEIRTKPGQIRIQNTKINKHILPSQLRLTYPEPKFDSDGTIASDSRLPLADFPHGWGGNMEAMRVDVKIPSEHWLEGREYVAEYQVYHLHHQRRKAPVISVMMDLHPQNVKNRHFQLALNEWQKVWEVDYLECEARRRRERRLDAGLFDAVRGWMTGAMGGNSSDADAYDNNDDRGFSTWLDEPSEEAFQRNLRAARRAQNQNAYWNPYDPDEIMRSIHFYGYSGSLTEPPCTEFVEWRILDTPMLISRDQLFQMKNLLFKHRDLNNDCRLTSNHYMGSVARRPLQRVNSRKVYRCTCRDFLSDAERDAILAEQGLTEENATFTPRCSREEFRKSEKEKTWLRET